MEAFEPPQVYLLAAGQGRRAGGPKAWRDCDGQPLLRRQLDFLCGFIAGERIAVSIQPDWLRRCQALDGRVQWVGVDPQAPALAAVLALARALPLDHWTYLIHVDMRVWQPEVYGLLAKRALPGTEAVVPVQGGRRGHPVLLSPRLKGVLSLLDPGRDRLDSWLRARDVAVVDVPFPCIHDNWNF
ncbi:MAG TPA: hypothetical protein DEB40_03100 [Elusimicrobia bacterium]|nr:hypothetical protein [Elusimicrobiota bacterium]HBT60718.1 hypothetical protein [Elusimicrobiota bacterium]